MPRNLRPAAPYADLPVTKYIDRRIATSSKTVEEIANDAFNGRTKDVEAMRSGEEKFQLDRIYLIAQSLYISRGHLFRLAFESYYPEIAEELAIIFGFYIASPHESYVLSRWRKATGNMDPLPTQTRERVEVIDRMMDMVKAVMAAEQEPQSASKL